MEQMFISELVIEKVRHLENITIPLSDEKPKHLLLTGKNGSGKTSVLEAMSRYLNSVATSDQLEQLTKIVTSCQNEQKDLLGKGIKNDKTIEAENWIEIYQRDLDDIKNGLDIKFNQPHDRLRYFFKKGQFVLAYYRAGRSFSVEVPKHVEKIKLKDRYAIEEAPREVFVKYLLDLKVTEALARNSGKSEKAEEISGWFQNLEELLRRIFDDNSLKLVFEEDTFSFWIQEKGKERFDFNTLSSGFAAVLDIVLDIIIRMEKSTNKTFNFYMPGIVLIDEIETHLHLELQKRILDLLTTVFPNIQFVMSTHSPFILNSLENVVIYDLENHMIVAGGLANVPYSGIVEGYFNASEMSASLKEKYERYKELIKKQELSDDDFEEIAGLEMFLDEIPDYLALNITTEYQRLKMEFEHREDV